MPTLLQFPRRYAVAHLIYSYSREAKNSAPTYPIFSTNFPTSVHSHIREQDFLTLVMPSISRNIWNPQFSGAGDLEQELEAGDPLLPWPSARRHSRRIPEAIYFEDIPPTIKSDHGNIFWADEQCTWRVGLTSTEARLFLRLLQVDDAEDWNYADYIEMFDNFGREQIRLEQLMRELPWWKIGSHRQKKIWEARIEWLSRMREPRPWLPFLMARRRRILKTATGRVLEGLRKKREARAMAGLRMQSLGNGQPISGGESGSVDPLIINKASKASDALVEVRQLKVLEYFEAPTGNACL